MHLYRALLRAHVRLRRAVGRADGMELRNVAVLFHEHALREERALLLPVALEVGAGWLPLRLARLQHADLGVGLARGIRSLDGLSRAESRRLRLGIEEHLAFEEALLFPAAVELGILQPLAAFTSRR